MLSNIELKNLAKQHGIKLDYVGYKDTMSNVKNKHNYNAIINLDGSNPDDFNKNGSHWVCLVIRDQLCVYFDPFGLPEPVQTNNFIKNQNIKHYGYNHMKIQDIKDDHCGWYCMALLRYIKDHYIGNVMDTANDFINIFDFNDSTNNLTILQNTF